MARGIKTKKLILCALFAALTAACSMISIPLPFSPVPINLATLSVFLAGGLLGAKGGAISQLVYVCLGAMGLPVFHNFTAGPAVLAGPTGGFLIGYIVAAFLVGLIASPKSKNPLHTGVSGSVVIALLVGLVACYALGTLWFMFVAGTSLWSALLMCVFPFLPGDTIKILLALLLIRKLRPIVNDTIY